MEMEPGTLNKILTPAIADLIHSLKTSFNNYDYSAAEESLLSWAQSVKLELSGSFSDELLFKEVDKIELEFKVSRLEKELGVLRKYINLQNGYDSSEEEESEDSESLSGFIVSGSESESSNSNSNSSHSNNLSSNSKSSSNFENLDDDVKLKEAVNKITRKKKTNNTNNNKWEYEADMLAEFGKKPETCLKAICALYKRQTEEEQKTKSTQILNKIGFSQFDAERASLMADFLMDGEPWGPVVKSVEELEEFDKYGLEYCERVAMKYSKQLFEMYEENEDPYFGPSLSD